MARKPKKQRAGSKSREKAKLSSSTAYAKNQQSLFLSVVILAGFVIASYVVLSIAREIYKGLESIKFDLGLPIADIIIGILQKATASFGPAMIVAGLLTLVEIGMTGRKRIVSSYKTTFWLLFISLALFGVVIELFEIALDQFNITPLFDVSDGRYSTLIIYGTALIYFFLTDVIIYWVHRLEHSNKTLWYLHKIHHAVEDLDSVTGFFHPVSNVIRWCATVLPLGFIISVNFNDIVILAAFLSIVHYLQHTRAPVHFGRLGKVIGDNRFHFIHHSQNPEHFNKNFAAVFPVIDMIFGTYLEPKGTALPTTGLNDVKGPTSTREFLTGRLQPK